MEVDVWADVGVVLGRDSCATPARQPSPLNSRFDRNTVSHPWRRAVPQPSILGTPDARLDRSGERNYQFPVYSRQWSMRAKVKYGGVVFLIGAVILIGSAELGFTDVMWVGALAVAIGGASLYMAFEKWYCAACGQFLGRGSQPDRCERCGSNRVTTEDPGAVR